MLAVTRPWGVRAAVEGRPEPPFDRLLDPLTRSLVDGDEPAREWFGGLWRDGEALARLTTKRTALDAGLAVAMHQMHERLGAGPESLSSLAALAGGEAVCAIAGQQPAPLGGPLYSLHKVAAAVGLARRVTARTGVPCVPVFWNHVEDSDFEEIRGVTAGDPSLALTEYQLPPEVHEEGGLVGDVPPGPVARLCEDVLARWVGLPGHDAVANLVRGAFGQARDLGEAHAALMLGLFGSHGLVVVDPRWPAFRAAARPVIERYLDHHEVLEAAARRAGDVVQARLGRRPLSDAALESFVFALRDGRRRKVRPEDARREGSDATWIPNVALRPIIQDHVLPTVVMACGPGELAYLAQLRPVFEGMGVRPACPVPRLGATWLPPAALHLLEVADADPWTLVASTDQVLRRHAEHRVPADLKRDLEALRDDLQARLEGFARQATSLDPSLPQMVESARGKMDYQLTRLLEGLAGKARHRMEREHPEWLRLRYYLLPGDRLQERRLAALEPVAYRGPSMVKDLCNLAEAHAGALESGRHPHYLLEL